MVRVRAAIKIIGRGKGGHVGPGPLSPRFDVVKAVAPVRRSLGLKRMGRWMARGVGVGATAGALMLAGAQLYSFGAALPAALSAVGVGAAAGLIVGLRSWPSSLEAARAVDHHFALRDRLTTALELQSSNETFPLIQRSEAAGRLQGLRLRKSARVGVSWRETVPAALAVAAFLALWIFPGPPPVASAPMASVSDVQRIQTAATVRLPALKRSVEGGLQPAQLGNPSLRKLDLALSHLRTELLRSRSRTTALRSVSLAQQQLRQLEASLHPISPQAAARLTSSLAGSMNSKQANAPLPSSKSLAAAAQTLNRLAGALNRMTPAQRSRLARNFARASNATADATLGSMLHQAASSVTANDPRAAASTLRQAAAKLSSSPSAASAKALLTSASAQLDNLKYEISGLMGEPSQRAGSSGQVANNNSGNPDKSRPSGNGRNRGAGKAAAGRGQSRGAGRGQARGSGAGRGSGNGSRIAAGQSGSGGTGGHSSTGGRGGNAPRRHGNYATVYSPFQERSGPHSFLSGQRGRPTLSGIIPYQEVIAQYRRSARTALSRSSLTPAQQSTVRRYFSSISH